MNPGGGAAMNGKTPIPGYPGGGGGKPLCILRKFGWVQNKKPVIGLVLVKKDIRFPFPFSPVSRFPFVHFLVLLL